MKVLKTIVVFLGLKTLEIGIPVGLIAAFLALDHYFHSVALAIAIILLVCFLGILVVANWFMANEWVEKHWSK